MNFRTIGIIFRRELQAFFLSPIAYVVAFFWLLLTGFSFYFAIAILNKEPSEYTVMQVFFGIFFIWLAQVMMVPILTMRTFSEEYRLGTFEGLMTAPVRDWEVVLGKFLAVLIFYLILWSPTALYPFLFKLVTFSTTPLTAGPVWCSYLVVLLMGMFYVAIGLLASSLTRNQIIAAVIAFATIALFFFTGFLIYFNIPFTLRELVGYLSAYDHMEQFSKGLVNTKVLVFYLSMTVMTLLITQKVIESRRWKG
ncbi:MAG: ABC transporter permease [Verrucomicrobiae bacterium]|nr:ABC transporter permease [Verrucomicrobiae bacterium]